MRDPRDEFDVSIEQVLTPRPLKARGEIGLDVVFVLQHWPAGRPTRVAADMQSFFALGREPMETVTGDVVRNLANRPAFLGLAFHDYLGLRELLSRR